MNKPNIPGPDPDNLLKRTLKDDLPTEAATRMNRQFTRFKHMLDRTERLPESDGWLWMRGPFRKEILAVASAVMIILGLVMQLGGSQSALAHSIEQLKVILTISAGLDLASSMDCTILKPDAEGKQTSYRIRWRAAGDVRVDMDSAEGSQTLWISNETISIAGAGESDVSSMSIHTMAPGPVWQPALELLSPEILEKQLEEAYRLWQISGRTGSGTKEFLIFGLQGQQDVEITIDAKTYLPKVLKKYSPDSGSKKGTQDCLVEARFFWNQPIPEELFSPRPPAAE